METVVKPAERKLLFCLAPVMSNPPVGSEVANFPKSPLPARLEERASSVKSEAVGEVNSEGL